MKKYHVIFPNPNGEGNRIYGLVRTETMGLRMARMGRNERDKTLSKKGKLLVKILDFFDENHCKNSIKEF